MSNYDASSLSDPERLAALRASGLLRHGPQERLDLLCETATMILSAPVSQVNVLDDKYQTSIGKWPPDHARTMAVEDSACQHVVVATEPVAIENTLLHPVMCLSPVVRIAGVRAYLGVPIFYDGQVLGSFCVGDFVPRKWGHWDIAGLQGLARLAGLSVIHE